VLARCKCCYFLSIPEALVALATREAGRWSRSRGHNRVHLFRDSPRSSPTFLSWYSTLLLDPLLLIISDTPHFLCHVFKTVQLMYSLFNFSQVNDALPSLLIDRFLNHQPPTTPTAGLASVSRNTTNRSQTWKRQPTVDVSFARYCFAWAQRLLSSPVDRLIKYIVTNTRVLLMKLAQEVMGLQAFDSSWRATNLDQVYGVWIS
jgi:hypothetical protein